MFISSPTDDFTLGILQETIQVCISTSCLVLNHSHLHEVPHGSTNENDRREV